MALVSLDDVKNYLGIPLENTADDVQLQAILTGVLSNITQIVGDLSYGDKTIQILNTTVKDSIVWFKHKYVESIKSINGVDYTGKTNGVDYLLRSDDTAFVTNYEGIISNDFGAFNVVYVAGWKVDPDADPDPINEVPADFVSIVADITALQFSLDYGRSITRETMGPRTVEYSDSAGRGSGGSGKTPMGILQARLRKYQPMHLRLW